VEAVHSAAIVAVLICVWRLYRRDVRLLERATVVIFTALAVGQLLIAEPVGKYALAFAFAGLGLFALTTVLLRAPWTAEFSRADHPGEAQSSIFAAVNMVLSGIWGVLLLLLSLVSVLHAPGLFNIAILTFGATMSIFGPRWLVRRALSKRASNETYHWPAPKRRAGDDVDVAVVGAGIGGLTAAALLADAGLRVCVAEQHSQVGGFCQSFRRRLHHNGQPLVYRFDAGPHDFSGVWQGGPVSSVLERLDLTGRIAWRRIDHTYRLPDLVLGVPEDWRSYAAELARRFPATGVKFEELFTVLKAIYDGMYSPLIASGGIPGLGMRVETMQAFARQYPAAVEWMDKPFDELVSRYVSDPQARQVIGMLIGYISDGSERLTCADMVPVFGYYFKGGHYPVGGSGKLAETLAAAVTERGGQVLLNSPVRKIRIDEHHASGLLLADGRTISASMVVSNADLRRTFLDFIDPDEIPAEFRSSVAAAQPALSAFTVHLGLDFVPQVRPAVMVSGDRRFSLTTLSLLDPSAAPAGHSTLIITSLLARDQAKEWFPNEEKDWMAYRQSAHYAGRKKLLGDQMIAAAEQVIPRLSSHIIHRDEASPITFSRYDRSSAGSIYGVRKSNRFHGAKSPVAGLVLAGSATHGPGVEAAVISGAYAANALLPGLLDRPPSRDRKRAA
jgi:phytoene dehydrogenase-like protein